MWKTFGGKCIYQSPTGIQVYQNVLFRWLKFNSRPLQTLINRYMPHCPELYYVKPFTVFVRVKPASCCMLGLGGGGVAHALWPYLGKIKVTAVENDCEVIDIAQRYFMLDQLYNLNVIHQDARLFVEQTTEQFQHVLVDLFEAENFPLQCNNEAFFSHCKRILLDSGILAINLANREEQWPIMQLIKNNFHNTLAVAIKKSANIVVFAVKNEPVDFLPTVLKQSKKLNALFWDSKWGQIAEITG
ncbi:spermidine synthase [Legionella jordanis]|uniref:Spermidine synthase n=1 Tax=Legionella jordanis TaxID=456 RepID=A0A0W0VA27_9GAMM|nr:fused MFS/spermidine synthase [Legionella jordanis]KTD17015.1 spermidine synthase [Legionella jordanis]RMX03155.1 hypothetical protein EAW55_06905 [Legionella jordanis]RMX18706.1 hypothetical protein EAS68_07790 [Legionella jordanis]VEH12789.1 spermidine synthase [Legionella jordanis]HAT8713066.1 hypothetical protein [Legionella jordanis]